MAIAVNYFPAWKSEFATDYDKEKPSTSHYKLLSLCFSVTVIPMGVAVICYRSFMLNPSVRERCRPYIKLNSVALVRTRTIPTERPPPVGEVSANFCG